MELCPKCGLMCAERSHYTKLLICYNRSCGYHEKEDDEKVMVKPNSCYKMEE